MITKEARERLTIQAQSSLIDADAALYRLFSVLDDNTSAHSSALELQERQYTKDALGLVQSARALLRSVPFTD